MLWEREVLFAGAELGTAALQGGLTWGLPTQLSPVLLSKLSGTNLD